MQTLRLFVDVARCRSFSRAAAAHGVTQSAASQRIGHLEKRLGATLLDRSVRPLVLTPAGRVFFDGCLELLGAYDRLQGQVVRLAETGERAGHVPGEADAGHEDPAAMEGLVRVAAIYSSGIELLDRLREQFIERHPRIEVEIRYNHPEQVYEAVRARACDLGILSYPQRWRRVGVIPLRDEVMAVVCPPDHPLARRRCVEPAELSGHEMVSFDRDLPVGRRIRRYLREHETTPRLVNSFDNLDTIKGVLSVTDRFSILPQRTVAREVAAGLLRTVALVPRLTRPIGIIYPRRPRHDPLFSAPAQAFVDHLLAHAGPQIEGDTDVEPPATDRRPLVGEQA